MSRGAGWGGSGMPPHLFQQIWIFFFFGWTDCLPQAAVALGFGQSDHQSLPGWAHFFFLFLPCLMHSCGTNELSQGASRHDKKCKQLLFKYDLMSMQSCLRRRHAFWQLLKHRTFPLAGKYFISVRGGGGIPRNLLHWISFAGKEQWGPAGARWSQLPREKFEFPLRGDHRLFKKRRTKELGC